MNMSGLKVFVSESSAWGPSEWISLALAIITLTAVLFGYLSSRQAKRDNEKSYRLAVAQVNREGVIRIYANSLAALRGTLSDLTTNILNVEIRKMSIGAPDPYGDPQLVAQIWLDESNSEDSLNRVRHNVIREFMTAEHKAQMDLLGDAELVQQIDNWLSDFTGIKVTFENRAKFLNQQMRNSAIADQDLSQQLEQAKTKAVVDLDPLEDQLREMHLKMKEELTIK